MKVRISKRQYSNILEVASDMDIAAEMAVKVLKSNPMVVGEPVAEVSPGCPIGYAKASIVVHYDMINPSKLDKIKMFITRTPLSQAIKETKVG